MPLIIIDNEKFMISVHYEEEEHEWLKEILQFEATRILSLESRNITPKTEKREWDSMRGISVSSRLLDES